MRRTLMLLLLLGGCSAESTPIMTGEEFQEALPDMTGNEWLTYKTAEREAMADALLKVLREQHDARLQRYRDEGQSEEFIAAAEEFHERAVCMASKETLDTAAAMAGDATFVTQAALQCAS